MMRIPLLIGVSVAALSLATWVVVASQRVDSDESAGGKIEKVMDGEAAKERFTGAIGDFVVLPLEAQGSDESRLFGCRDGSALAQVDRVGSTLRSEELWSAAFDVPEGVGWSCPGEGVVLVNNQGMHGQTSDGDGTAKIRGFITSTPVNVVRDAPRDRLELVAVDGHPGLLERPIEGYPYGRASLIVIERYPKGDVPGIVVLIERAASADAALKSAEEIIP